MVTDFMKAVQLLEPVFATVAIGLESGASIVTALTEGALALAKVIEEQKARETAEANAAGLAKFPDLEIES